MQVLCPCGAECVKASGADIYPHRSDLRHLRFWRCPSCGRYVGSHKESGEPLGIPADARTRKARSGVHALFDPLWIGKKGRNRRRRRDRAYQWLADQLGIPKERCHIGSFDHATCIKASAICARISQEDIHRIEQYDPDPEATSFIGDEDLREAEPW